MTIDGGGDSDSDDEQKDVKQKIVRKSEIEQC